MESLGKVATADGSPSACRPGLLSGACRARTASIHSFNGCTRTPPAPVDFILCEQPDHAYARNHELLIANCLAQRSALLRGKTFER